MTDTHRPGPVRRIFAGSRRSAGQDLAALLGELGVQRGGTLLVHAALGGSGLDAAAARDALLDALGPDGTLVVPAFTQENSDTSRAHRRRTAHLTEPERIRFRAGMPPYDPAISPCTGMGMLAECVRTTPGAVRSAHPQTSFAGLGPRAAELLADHDPECHLGERSPLAALHRADAQILLFRVGFEVCSAFHLAEYRTTPPPPTRTYRCVTVRTGHWVEYRDAVLDDSDFAAIGAQLPRGLTAEREFAGKAVILVPLRAAVDAAVRLMTGSGRGLT
ncbi:aminoglycoside N(3)-acetyltransferase [Streptomyces triticagri]|uniref:Aminoglycoside N(3)-acetyltransferase n=1 Tax=Streptomyces triticagri TaxID=2293568 RepID=A0A372M1A2_9ACTN|nr:AAC(3) family N-acetyltransferase [Streptomyces triticagri]RFU84698.1 aminoglycoside N(3)-acetyltransferase [Streptomyces triticagri]